jgi:hypothetical protein
MIEAMLNISESFEGQRTKYCRSIDGCEGMEFGLGGGLHQADSSWECVVD